MLLACLSNAVHRVIRELSSATECVVSVGRRRADVPRRAGEERAVQGGSRDVCLAPHRYPPSPILCQTPTNKDGAPPSRPN
eukprot:1206689-Rhodomonas_salina.1